MCQKCGCVAPPLNAGVSHRMKALRSGFSKFEVFAALWALVALGVTFGRLIWGRQLRSMEDALFGPTQTGRIVHALVIGVLAAVWLYILVKRERRRQPDESVPLVRWQVVALSIAVLAICIIGLLWARLR